MSIRDWSKYAELIGITAIVVSLVFVGLQIKQAEDIADATRRSSVVANQIELTNAINEYADIWRRGNAGEPLDDTEAVIHRNLVVAKYRFHEGEFSAASRMDVAGGMRAHSSEMAIYLRENLGARRVWNKYRDAFFEVGPVPYPDSFSKSVITTIEQLDQARE